MNIDIIEIENLLELKTATQIKIVLFVFRYGGCSTGEMAKALGVSNQSITNALKSLSKKFPGIVGVIQRFNNEKKKNNFGKRQKDGWEVMDATTRSFIIDYIESGGSEEGVSKFRNKYGFHVDYLVAKIKEKKCSLKL